MPDTILIFGINPRKKTTCATLLHVNITCVWIFCTEVCNCFLQITKADIDVCKIKEMPSTYKRVTLKQRNQEQKRPLSPLSKMCFYLSFILLELTSVDTKRIRLCGLCSLAKAWEDLPDLQYSVSTFYTSLE